MLTLHPLYQSPNLEKRINRLLDAQRKFELHFIPAHLVARQTMDQEEKRACGEENEKIRPLGLIKLII